MNRRRSVQVISIRFGDKDPMTLGPFLLLIALGVVFALIWVWIDPALALDLGSGAVGILLVVGMCLRPHWIKAF